MLPAMHVQCSKVGVFPAAELSLHGWASSRPGSSQAAQPQGAAAPSFAGHLDLSGPRRGAQVGPRQPDFQQVSLPASRVKHSAAERRCLLRVPYQPRQAMRGRSHANAGHSLSPPAASLQTPQMGARGAGTQPAVRWPGNAQGKGRSRLGQDAPFTATPCDELGSLLGSCDSLFGPVGTSLDAHWGITPCSGPSEATPAGFHADAPFQALFHNN